MLSHDSLEDGVILICIYFLNLTKMSCWDKIILFSFFNAYDLAVLILVT